MSKFELKLPQMGESVAEATLTTWLKEVGDTIALDEPVFEIATDKVDSEVPSEVEGTLVEKLFEVDDVIKVGEVVAVIATEGSEMDNAAETKEDITFTLDKEESIENQNVPAIAGNLEAEVNQLAKNQSAPPNILNPNGERFYSPLVKNMAKEEGVSMQELDQIKGTGQDGRVTKSDMLAYLEKRSSTATATPNNGQSLASQTTSSNTTKTQQHEPKNTSTTPALEQGDELIPLSRMGKLIAQHMTHSLATSAHVQSFVEVDVTNMVNWRKRVKNEFLKREGEKLTFTPLFLEAVAAAIKKYPLINISLEGDTVVKKKAINIGMAAALPDGNLIVPVIKNADQLNLVGMAKTVNDLATRARENNLKPDEVKSGTYTVTNVGSFGSVFGTPIINQPQVGILALGAIRKTPAVIETPDGDFIGVRHKMFLSHSYDHRVVNGALGGMFVKEVADYLEAWNIDRTI